MHLRTSEFMRRNRRHLGVTCQSLSVTVGRQGRLALNLKDAWAPSIAGNKSIPSFSLLGGCCTLWLLLVAIDLSFLGPPYRTPGAANTQACRRRPLFRVTTAPRLWMEGVKLAPSSLPSGSLTRREGRNPRGSSGFKWTAGGPRKNGHRSRLGKCTTFSFSKVLPVIRWFAMVTILRQLTLERVAGLGYYPFDWAAPGLQGALAVIVRCRIALSWSRDCLGDEVRSPASKMTRLLRMGASLNWMFT